MTRDCRVLLAGDRPGSGAGNAVSSDVLLAALRQFAAVDVLSHRMSLWPSLRVDPGTDAWQSVTIGTQPITVHGEALASGWLHRRRLRQWPCAWAATSRYASSLYASGMPYVVWEATPARDEMDAISIRAVRRNGNGTGFGAAAHRILSPVDERLECEIYRNARHLLAMSEYTRTLIVARHGILAERVEVLLSPPSTAFLHALDARTRSSSPPPCSQRPARLLFVGRVTDPRKNAGMLLEAFQIIRQNMPNATLTIVGRHTQQWRNNSGVDLQPSSVSLTGEIDLTSLASAYLAHDLLLVSSRQEGYGLVVAEALHAGLPVVSTRCGGPESIIRDSRGGALVDHTSSALAEGALGLLSNQDRWLSCSMNAATYARTVLSFEKFATRVSDITNSVVRDLAA